jgi:hypothetical protein
MKRSVLIVLAFMLFASVAFAQNGSIMVFSDLGASNCNWALGAGGFAPVYVFHMYTPGATASEWRLSVPAGWNHLGDQSDFFLTLGASVDGTSISYEVCKQGNFKLMTVNFLGSAPADPACTLIGIVDIQVINCADGRVFPPGGSGILNSDGSCDCDVPVEETTWGGIKALYQ